jgi:hypothetical protein
MTQDEPEELGITCRRRLQRRSRAGIATAPVRITAIEERFGGLAASGLLDLEAPSTTT